MSIFISVEIVSLTINVALSFAISRLTPSGSISLNFGNLLLTSLEIFIALPSDTFSIDILIAFCPLNRAIVSTSLKLSSTIAISLRGKLTPSSEVKIMSAISSTESNSPTKRTLKELFSFSNKPPGIFLFFN